MTPLAIFASPSGSARSRPGNRAVTWSAVVATSVLLAGCSEPAAPLASTPSPAPSSVPTTTPPPGPPEVALPAPDRVDGNDPEAVGRAALRVMWAADTTADTGWHQATLRAAAYLAPAYLAQLRAQGPARDPGAEWRIWARHRAYLRPQLRPGRDEHPPDTATQALRQWLLTLTPIGRDGWRGRPRSMTVFVELTRARGAWKLSAIAVR